VESIKKKTKKTEEETQYRPIPLPILSISIQCVSKAHQRDFSLVYSQLDTENCRLEHDTVVSVSVAAVRLQSSLLCISNAHLSLLRFEN